MVKRISAIAYDISKSNYMLATENFRYYFSSMLYLYKFEERYKQNRIDMKYRLSSRYNIELDAPDYFDFILYADIEKRGFRVVDMRGVKFGCIKEAKLNGEIKTLQNCNVL